LSEPEKIVFRRLAVFRGRFELDVGFIVASDTKLTNSDVAVSVMNLAARSLLATDTSGAQPHYSFLDTTRAYAFEKLATSGDSTA